MFLYNQGSISNEFRDIEDSIDPVCPECEENLKSGETHSCPWSILEPTAEIISCECCQYCQMICWSVVEDYTLNYNVDFEGLDDYDYDDEPYDKRGK